MRALELYYSLSTLVDSHQKAIHNHVRDQLQMSLEVLDRQDKMKRLAEIIIKEGDRDLTGIEIVELQKTKE